MGKHSAVRVLDCVTYDNFADYGGSDRKNGIILNGEWYMVKFQEHETARNVNQTSNVNNVAAEFLSSHIAASLGLPAHETLIVSIEGELAVACKNFETPGTRHIDFDRFMHRHYDSKDVGRHPTLAQVEEVLATDRQLGASFEENMRSFWDMFVFDAIVGNYDRHGGNWGYLARADSDVALQSPLYDNASTFYPAVSEDYMPSIMAEAKEVAKRVVLFPNSAIEHCGHRMSYYDVLMSGWEGPAEAVARVVPNADRQKIVSLIDHVPMSDVRKAFCKTMVLARLELMLYPALELARKRSFDKESRRRLEEGARLSEGDFERLWRESCEGTGKDDALHDFAKTYHHDS